MEEIGVKNNSQHGFNKIKTLLHTAKQQYSSQQWGGGEERNLDGQIRFMSAVAFSYSIGRAADAVNVAF